MVCLYRERKKVIDKDNKKALFEVQKVPKTPQDDMKKVKPLKESDMNPNLSTYSPLDEAATVSKFYKTLPSLINSFLIFLLYRF